MVQEICAEDVAKMKIAKNASNATSLKHRAKPSMDAYRLLVRSTMTVNATMSAFKTTALSVRLVIYSMFPFMY